MKRIVTVFCLFSLLLARRAQSEVPAGAMESLVGPLTPMGAPAEATGIATYDAAEQSRGKFFAEQFPYQPNDLVSSNYYDLALTLYVAYYRSGDTYWLDQARRVARTWRDSNNNQNIPKYLAADYSVGPTIPPPRSMSTLGLAVLALESGDAAAREVVNNHARLVEQAFVQWMDAREAGYSLMALVAASIVGDDHRLSALGMLDVILAHQKPDGHWEQTSNLVPNNQPFVLNFMTGVLMEGLVFYDRVIGDPRIVPAIQRCIDWTWGTQWVAGAQAFQYGNVNSGSVSTSPAGDLNGLMLPAWGWALLRTGDSRYRDQGQQIFAGMVANSNALLGEKHYGQFYRSSGRYLGFLQAFDARNAPQSSQPQPLPPPPTPDSSTPAPVTAPAGCTQDSDCNDNPCATGICDPSGSCSYVDKGTCCCQQFAAHCFTGCNGCRGTCAPGQCTATNVGGRCE